MSHQLAEDRNRQAIPRWRSFGYAIQLGELDPSSQGKGRLFRKEILKHIQQDWKDRPGLSVACDLVCTAFSIGLQDQVEDAAQFILRQENAPQLAREIAARCVSKKTIDANQEFHDLYFIRDVDAMRTQIGVSRQFLKAYPRNPVSYTHLTLPTTPYV